MTIKLSLIMTVIMGISFLIEEMNIITITFWDNVFLFSLIVLMIGGILYLIEKNIFEHVLRQFKLFYKRNNKIQKYVSEVEYEDDIGEKTKLIDISIAKAMVKSSVYFMGISIAISYFYYY